MWSIRSLAENLFVRPKRTPRVTRSRRRAVLGVENLESRDVPSAFGALNLTPMALNLPTESPALVSQTLTVAPTVAAPQLNPVAFNTLINNGNLINKPIYSLVPYSYMDGSNLVCSSPWTGTHTVQGAILAEYQALGGPNGFLGYPTTDQTPTADGAGNYSVFENGTIYWSPATGAHVVYGAIGGKYDSLGGEQSFLGFPTSDEADSGGGGRVTRFQGGDIYWSAATGPNLVKGAIRDEYNALGGASSFAGLPITDELPTADGVGRYNDFQNGASIYWSPTTGAHFVSGAIHDKYVALGATQSPIGYPVDDAYVNADGFVVSDFQNGSIVWRSDVGVHLSFGHQQIIGAIRATEADGVLDASEFQFLQNAADNPDVYMSAADHDLTHKLIDGDPANAWFQGMWVGNLQPGSPSWAVEDLLQKWFEGTDLPYASDSQNNVYGYAQDNAPLFGSYGPSYTDIKQGLVGDCYFMAALGEVALKHPDIIENMFIDNGDGTFTVRFFPNGTPEYVTVNRMLPVDASGNLVFAGIGQNASTTQAPIWVALAEKAYAQLNESGQIAQDGSNSYNGIPGTSVGGINGGRGSDALHQITGWSANEIDIGWTPWAGGNFADDAGAAYRNGLCVVVATNSSGISDNVLVPNHEYILIAVDPTDQVFVVVNPWGVDALGGFEITVLTRDQFIANFNAIDDA